MNDNFEELIQARIQEHERMLNWFDNVIHAPMRVARFCILAIMIGHLFFDFDDFGITVWHLFAFWALDVSLLVITTSYAARRLRVPIK